MAWLFALQFALPLVFIGWIAIAPARSLFGFWVQVVATASGLLAAGLTGLWLLPPWWAPYAFGCVLLLAIFIGLRRRRPFAAVRPSHVGGWALAAAYLVLGAWAADRAATALAGRAAPSARLAPLAFPLASGTYLVVNGGNTLSINAHLMTLDAAVPRFRAFRGQSLGIDIVQVDRLGLRATGVQPTRPDAYRIYGSPVFAPCAGEVVVASDGLPDRQVPQVDRAHLAGNHALLRCADADVLLGHFKPGSLQVTVGTRVRVGDRIGMVGNSGNTGEPHLHIQAQTRGTAAEPMSGEPLPMRLNGRYLVRNDRVSVP